MWASRPAKPASGRRGLPPPPSHGSRRCPTSVGPLQLACGYSVVGVSEPRNRRCAGRSSGNPATRVSALSSSFSIARPCATIDAARGCHGDRPRAAPAHDERHADRGLELGDLVADRRARVPEPARGGDEAPLLDDRHEREQRPELDAEPASSLERSLAPELVFRRPLVLRTGGLGALSRDLGRVLASPPEVFHALCAAYAREPEGTAVCSYDDSIAPDVWSLLGHVFSVLG